MENLNNLSPEILEDIIYELDDIVSFQQETINSLYADLENSEKAVRHMIHKRDYWRSKYNELKETNVPVPVKRQWSRGKIYEDEATVTPEEILKKKPFKHTKKSTSGNLTGSKHSGHMSKDEQLFARFDDGDVMAFDTVEEAKTEVRSRYPKYANSGLTNISSYARQSKSIYGVHFTYDEGLKNKWLGSSEE